MIMFSTTPLTTQIRPGSGGLYLPKDPGNVDTFAHGKKRNAILNAHSNYVDAPQSVVGTSSRNDADLVLLASRVVK